jgi:PAS domain S-box-containing protein
VEPSEAVLGGLLAAAPDALLAADANGVIVYVNDQAERLFEWSKADLIGQSVECLVPERFARKHPELRAGYVRQPTARPMGAGLKLLARRKDGTEFPAEISLSSFPTESGTLLAAAVRDVTVARQTEQRFRAVLSSAPDAIVGVNAAGEIELVNVQAERLFGWTTDQLIGQRVEVLVPAGVAERHVGHRAGYIEDPTPRPMGAGLHLSGRRKDGSQFPAEISLSTVTDDRDATLVLAAVRDITDRMELEAERRRQSAEAQRERSHRLESLGQLAGGVAHDFNNLLGVIMNYTRLLSRQMSDSSMEADLEEIRAAAQRGAALTRQLLTFARKDVVNAEPLEVTEVVRGVASMLERTLGEHITLELRLAEEPLVTMADPHQLEQILLNVALNARDAMGSGGTLTISAVAVDGAARGADADVVLSVADTGKGMPPEIAARVFEPFFTTKPRGQGTGLGLATVYGIVRQNGGEVSIESIVGAGTTVTMRMPSTQSAAAPKTVSQEDSMGGHERILLVEDEEPLRRGTARLLRECGYEVVVAGDGHEALGVFEREGPTIDLVLTDVAMPGMRGNELADRLSALGYDVPVLFMSGHDSGSQRINGRMLQKPVDESLLMRAVREALGG